MMLVPGRSYASYWSWEHQVILIPGRRALLRVPPGYNAIRPCTSRVWLRVRMRRITMALEASSYSRDALRYDWKVPPVQVHATKFETVSWSVYSRFVDQSTNHVCDRTMPCRTLYCSSSSARLRELENELVGLNWCGKRERAQPEGTREVVLSVRLVRLALSRNQVWQVGQPRQLQMETNDPGQSFVCLVSLCSRQL